MRGFLTLIAGGPERVAITTVGIVVTGFLASGHADALLRGLFVTVVFATAAMLIGLSLCFLAEATGLDAEGAVAKPSPKKGTHRDAA